MQGPWRVVALLCPLAAGCANDFAGDSCAAAADTDGLADSGGAIYLVRGPVSGTVSLDAAAATIYGATADPDFGIEVAAAGDLDGDSRGDVLAAALARGQDNGIAFAFLGPISGVGSDVDAALGIGWDQAFGDGFIDVTAPGEVDGDGSPDIRVGASDGDVTGVGGGAAFLFSAP